MFWIFIFWTLLLPAAEQLIKMHFFIVEKNDVEQIIYLENGVNKAVQFYRLGRSFARFFESHVNNGQLMLPS
jgi:hypothetical protein